MEGKKVQQRNKWMGGDCSRHGEKGRPKESKKENADVGIAVQGLQQEHVY